MRMSSMDPENHKIPRWVERALKLFYAEGARQEKLGDLEELVHNEIQKKGKFNTMGWYFFQIIRLLRSESQLSFYWGFAMFRNYVTIAFRSLKRHKIYSFITISGLTLGMAAFLLISVWVLH